MKTWIAACAVLAGLVLASAAAAGQCGYRYCWGAVGFGPGGVHGYAYGQRSEQAAYNVAAEGCGWDCTNIKTFHNACAAMAVGHDGGWGWAHDSIRARAETAALNHCGQHTYNCRVVVWSCSR
ncbi:DUF4189 domain-containing protein [Roseovarius salinarum]|uniref:DUF4189 domain-containing protein n=1 Tax=Roseovarius salinarum TaxID=1981892 RepID=UPI000C3334CA|nr:DUF4189 domain-containing protein [Roseovarius salinarum]